MKSGPKWKPEKVAPLDPPATEAELDLASRVWTDAQDVMVARGFGRVLFGATSKASNEFTVLMLRAHARIQAEAATPERYVRDVEAGGSALATPTNSTT
jgi:hypothetical protein